MPAQFRMTGRHRVCRPCASILSGRAASSQRLKAWHDAVDHSSVAVVKCGWVAKQGDFFRTWRQRFLVLQLVTVRRRRLKLGSALDEGGGLSGRIPGKQDYEETSEVVPFLAYYTAGGVNASAGFPRGVMDLTDAVLVAEGRAGKRSRVFSVTTPNSYKPGFGGGGGGGGSGRSKSAGAASGGGGSVGEKAFARWLPLMCASSEECGEWMAAIAAAMDATRDLPVTTAASAAAGAATAAGLSSPLPPSRGNRQSLPLSAALATALRAALEGDAGPHDAARVSLSNLGAEAHFRPTLDGPLVVNPGAPSRFVASPSLLGRPPDAKAAFAAKRGQGASAKGGGSSAHKNFGPQEEEECLRVGKPGSEFSLFSIKPNGTGKSLFDF